MTSYTLRDLILLTGETKPTVAAWVRNAVIVADLEAPTGTGNWNRYSVQSLVCAVVVSHLRRLGLVAPATLQKASLAVFEIELAIEKKEPRIQEIWHRVTDPARRRDSDHALLVLSDDVAGGFQVLLSEGTVRVDPTIGPVWVAVNLRQAIEAVEQFSSGDTWINVRGTAPKGKRRRK